MASLAKPSPATTQENEAWIKDASAQVSRNSPDGKDEHSRILARLNPDNDAARQAFHDVAQALQNDKLLPHHAQFLVLHQAVPKLVSQPPDYVSDSDADNDHLTANFPSQLLHGHFEIRLDKRLITTGCRLGKGSSKFSEDRNVDILLMPPMELRSPHRVYNERAVAPNHCRIIMQPKSGALLLVADRHGRTTRYLDHDHLSLTDADPLRVLFHRQCHLTIGELQYRLEHMLDPEASSAFVEQRNALMRQHDATCPLPHPKILATPPRGIQQVAGAIIHTSLTNGAFGFISTGVLLSTGEPIAIKEMRIIDDRISGEVKREAEIAARFKEVKKLVLSR